MKKTRINQIAKPFVVAGLVAANLWQMAPALAATAAGTSISNTASATFEDPGGTVLESESNEVIITVAAVAGLTNVPVDVDDLDGESIASDDTLEYLFEVTNTGNTTAEILLPEPIYTNVIPQDFTNEAGTNVPEAAAAGQNAAVLASDGTILGYIDFANPGQLLDAGGAVAPDAGPIDGAQIIGGELILEPGAAVRVVVSVVPVAGLAAGDELTVQFGDTPPNDNSADTQNQDWDTTDPGDVRTDHTGGNIPAASVGPVNGEREAAAILTDLFAAPDNTPFARLLKDSALIQNDLDNPLDDQITYDLTLEALALDPQNPSLSAGDLEGAPVTVDGTEQISVLISDAIPEGTVFDPSVPPVAPAGWTVVYTDNPDPLVSPITFDGTAGIDWQTVAPADPTTVTRIGFVGPADTDLPAGDTVTASFTVTNDSTVAPGSTTVIRNLGQVFGTDNQDNVVYDESGDQNSNNFNDDGTPPEDGDGNPDPGGGYDPGDNTGVPDPNGGDGDDPGGNTGEGPDGESNITTVPGAPIDGTDLLNGPDGNPGATGPSGGTNDDFQEALCTTTPSTLADAITYVNTVTNDGDSPIGNVTVEAITDFDLDGTPDLDVGTLTSTTTIVRLFFAGTGRYAEYTYDGTDFILAETGTGNGVNDDSADTPDGTLTPLLIDPVLNVAEEVDYEVAVFDPAATTCDDLGGVRIPLIAFADDTTVAGPGLGYGLTTGGAESISNLTFDAVLSGNFLELVKEAEVRGPNNELRDLTEAVPGDTITYTITYTNTSLGTDARNVVIRESGTGNDAATTIVDESNNNWALDNDGNGVIDTSHVIGSAVGTNVTFFNEANYDPTGTDAAPVGTEQSGDTTITDVSAYTDTVGTVAPGESGTFVFQRIIN